MSPSATTKSPNKKTGLLISVAIVALIVIAGALYLSGGLGRNQTSSLQDVLAGSASLNPQENTKDLCSTDQCVEGWSTSNGNFLQFESQGAAEQFATYLGDDARRWKNIVLDMRGKELSFDQKKEVIDTLFASRDWS